MEIPTKRRGAAVNAYLLLRTEGKVLLLLRQNTGYCDGEWGLVAGHVEDGESASSGMIREALEEAGLEITPSQLKVAHIMHRQSPDRLNVDLFFECLDWNGKATNCEPEKCAQFAFFPLSALPSNTMEYVAIALRLIEQGKFYSEWGWQP